MGVGKELWLYSRALLQFHNIRKLLAQLADVTAGAAERSGGDRDVKELVSRRIVRPRIPRHACAEFP
jgi:hypothetical protein